MKKKYYLSMDIGQNRGAFSKARHDIEIVLDRRNYEKILLENPSNKKSFFIGEMFIGIKSWIKVILSVHKDSIVFFQHPMPFSLVSYFMIPVLKFLKKSKVVCVIHDIYSLRDKKGKFKLYYYIKDISLLNRCDKVISHNDFMSNKLVECGVKKEILVPLEIFDYILTEDEYVEKSDRSKDSGIMIAGNLSGEKAHYLNLLGEIKGNVKILLFGPNFNKQLYENSPNICYKGMYKPEELPLVMDGSFGLVWDGDSLDECSGNIGSYLKINNPHKTSLYLASGFPIVVWEQSAMAKIVKKYSVGITLHSLKEVNKLNSITDNQYEELQNSVKKIGAMLRRGSFFEKAISNIENNLEDK